MTVGSLTINLGMITDDVTKGVAKTKSEMKSLEMSIGKISGLLGAVGVGGLGIGGTLGLLTKLTSKLDEISGTARFADRLGVATDELQGLQYAAKRSGIDVETFNTGLTVLAKNLGDAALKGGPAADALTRLGLNAKDLTEAGPGDAIMQIADALKNVENSFERSSIVRALAGRGGAAMAGFFLKGAEELHRLQEEAKSMGLTTDAAGVAAVRSAKASIAEMNASISGVWTQASVAAAPFIEKMILIAKWSARIATLSDAISFGRGLVGEPDTAAVAKKGQKGILDGLDESKLNDLAAKIIGENESPLDKFNEQMRIFNDLLEKGKLNYEDFDAAQKRANDTLQKSRGGNAALLDITDKMLVLQYGENALMEAKLRRAGESQAVIDIVLKEKDAYEELKASIEAANERDNQFYDDMMADAEEALQAVTDLQNQMWEDVTRAEEAALSPLDKYIEKIAELQDLANSDMGISQDAFDFGVSNALRELDQAYGKQQGKGGADAHVVGTAEEYKFRALLEQGGPDKDRTPKEILQTAKEQRDLQRETNALLAKQALEVMSI